MEDLIQIAVNNGLGIASFLALLYFVNYYIKKNNETTEKISNTLISVDKSLNDLAARVDKIEKQYKGDE